MILASTSDVIRLTSTAAINHDTHVSWADVTAGSSSPTLGNENHTYAAAQTDAAICAAPSSGHVKIPKAITVRNRDGSTSTDVTLKHYDGTTNSELWKGTLLAGETVVWFERVGFRVFDAQGRLKVRNDGLATSSSPSYTTVVLGSDVTNNNASANTIADVTALSFSVTSGNTYWFRFVIPYTANATTTGSRWSINGPATPTALYYRSEYSLTTTSKTINEGVSAYDTPAASSATSAATGANIAVIEGFIKPSANGTVIARFASEVSSAAIVAKAGAVCFWQQVI